MKGIVRHFLRLLQKEAQKWEGRKSLCPLTALQPSPFCPESFFVGRLLSSDHTDWLLCFQERKDLWRGRWASRFLLRTTPWVAWLTSTSLYSSLHISKSTFPAILKTSAPCQLRSPGILHHICSCVCSKNGNSLKDSSWSLLCTSPTPLSLSPAPPHWWLLCIFSTGRVFSSLRRERREVEELWFLSLSH